MKWYLSSFPKSGTHLLNALVKPITQDDEAFTYGTHEDPFSLANRLPLSKLMYHLSYMPDHHRMLGHAVYDVILDNFLHDAGIAHVFIYRDLRDVAVSQTYHILNDDHDTFRHYDREAYLALGGFDKILAAVWRGDLGYPGIEERWRFYEDWLDSSYTLCLKFCDVVADLKAAALDICELRRARSIDNRGKAERYSIQDIEAMVASARDTDSSRTFRRGVPGEWMLYRDVMHEWE